jgi:hypothetical protein
LELPDGANSDSGFLQSLITGDESWVYGYDPELRVLTGKHRNHREKKKRVMLIDFLDIEGIV